MAGTCGVSWTVEHWDVKIGLGGMTVDNDDSKKRKILPGSKLTAGLEVDDGPVVISTYQWTVDATCRPFIGYDPTAQAAVVTPYSTVTTSTMWVHLSKPGTTKVKCHFTGTVGGDAISGDASKDAIVKAPPDQDNTYVITKNSYPGVDCAFLPDGRVGLTFDRAGFIGKIVTPQPFFDPQAKPAQDPGVWSFCQVFTKCVIKLQKADGTWETPYDYPSCRLLDKKFPLSNSGADTYPADADTTGIDVDIPFVKVGPTAYQAIEVWMTFEDHTLYKPAGGTSKHVAGRKALWQWYGKCTWNPANPQGTLSLVGQSESLQGNLDTWPKQPEWTAVLNLG